ncbi:MAG: recombinase family protein [Christensenellales bacterium]
MSVSGSNDTATPMGKAMLYCVRFAQLERETIAERVSDNMQLLARTGYGWAESRRCCSVAPPSNAVRHQTIHRLRTAPNQAQAVKEAAAFANTGRAQAAQKALAQRAEYPGRGKPCCAIRCIVKQMSAYRYFAGQGAVLCCRNRPMERRALWYKQTAA